MGLDIKEYSWNYRMLHRLRRCALLCDGIDMEITDYYNQDEKWHCKYSEFIHHSDCDGVYISKSSKQYEKYKKEWDIGELMFGDLDKLKEEVEELNYSIRSHLFGDRETIAWEQFYRDVKSARKILRFG